MTMMQPNLGSISTTAFFDTIANSSNFVLVVALITIFVDIPNFVESMVNMLSG